MANKELVNYIKSELAKGHTAETIKVSLINAGGWNSLDLEEAFSEISNNNIPVVTKKRSKLIFIIPIIILFVGGSGFACWKFYEPEIKNLLGLSINNVETSDLKSDTDSKKKQIPPSITILSPVNGDKVTSGSTLLVRYKITGNNINGLIIAGDCSEDIQNKSEGEYTFECKIDDEKLGYINLGVIDVDKYSEGDLDKNTIKLEVVAPSNIKPVEITWFNEEKDKIQGRPDFVGLVGNDSEYIAVSIKYNDGSIRTIPFSYLKYTISDPSVLSFVPFDKDDDTVHLLPLKPGKATILLEYEGLKKEVRVSVAGVEYVYENTPYNFYFDLPGTKMNPSFDPNISSGFYFTDKNEEFVLIIKVFAGEKSATEKLAKKFLKGYVYDGKTTINDIEYDNYVWADGGSSSKHFLVYRDGIQYYLQLGNVKYMDYFGFIY